LALALCGWLALAVGSVDAADEAELKQMCADIPKLAQAIKKKDQAQVKKLVDGLKKNNLDAIMGVCGLRNLGGLGVGDKPGAIKPDGIEKKVEALGKKALLPTQAKDESAAIAKMAYEIAAVNELTIAHTPDKDMGQAKKKTWVDTAKDLQTASIELASAAEAKSPDPKLIQKAASRVDANCQKCHSEWR
jgi:cytochrome c556